jgi:hypothetical protein
LEEEFGLIVNDGISAELPLHKLEQQDAKSNIHA